MEGDEEGCVKHHNVVRAFGLVIASDVEHAYFVKHIKEWPQNDLNEDSKAISLFSEKVLEFSSALKYPSLELSRVVATLGRRNIRVMASTIIGKPFWKHGEAKSCRLYEHVDKFES
jgi:hypothetical protein